MSFTFSTPTPKGRHISKKVRRKNLPLYSSSIRETLRCNGRKSCLSKLLSLVQKQLQKYNIRDLTCYVMSYFCSSAFGLSNITKFHFQLTTPKNLCSSQSAISTGTLLFYNQVDRIRSLCHR